MNLARRTLRREPEPAPALPATIDPADVGAFKRRRMRRLADPRLRATGGRAFGPSGPPEPKPEPPRPVFADDPLTVAHREIVEREIAEIDEHARAIGMRLDSGRAGDFEMQELLAERRALAALRAEIVSDLGKPILCDRDGRPLDERMRAIIRTRTKELREQAWRSAEMAEREADHRQARQLRHDALRSRHLAEHEAQIRPSLRGYSFPG